VKVFHSKWPSKTRFMARPHWHRSRGRYFVAVDFDATVDETLVCLFAQTLTKTKTKSNNIQCDVIYGPFYSMGRFGHVGGPFWM